MDKLTKSTFIKFGFLGLAVVTVAGILFFLFTQHTQAPLSNKLSPEPAIPTNAQIEEKWGIRVSQVGVTASGGMVDFRFVVIDPEKAQSLLSNPDNLPILAAEDSGIYVNSAAIMSPRHDLNTGTTYFMLFRNTQGAIQVGTKVSVLFPDESKLEHVVAR